MTDEREGRQPVQVPRGLELLTAWCWRLLVVGLAVWVVAMVVVRLRIVLLPVAIALLLTTALMPVRQAMTARGVPTPLAMLGVVAVFFGALALAAMLVVPPLIDEFSDLPQTLESATDDIQQWFVDGPLALDPELVRDVRSQIEGAVTDPQLSNGAVLDGATMAGELVAGLLLALVITFFVVKDGELIQRTFLSWFPDRHRRRLRAAGNGAWTALGGYLLGAAILGLFEGVVIGLTMLVVGAGLALPVAVLTFVAAFFPFVGALTAGVVAVLVALVTSGPAAAGVVAVVAVVVQQLDADVLAPLIYGKALELHPLVVILAITSGGALAGLAGAFVAVPLVAVSSRAFAGLRAVAHAEAHGAPGDELEHLTEDPPQPMRLENGDQP